MKLMAYYDESGVCGMNFDNVNYHFLKNVFGDILAVYEGNGNLCGKYIYDAWENHKVVDANNTEITDESNIAILNPFRYRGYYFDTEFNLYYLQNRYYDPQLGRFISADISAING